MFAVPGWNLASEKPVQEQHRASKSHKAQSGLAAKKRKRSSQDNHNGRSTTGDNLEQLWENKFGGQATNPLRATKRQPRAELDHKPDKSKAAKSRCSSQAPSTKSQHGRESQHRPPKQKRSKGHNDQPAHLQANGSRPPTVLPALSPPLPLSTPTTLTPLQQKMRSKLTSARFRHLNETLYTTPSSTALNLFRESPALFAEYHAGFSQQVSSSWPTNPVDTFITSIRTRASLDSSASSDHKTTSTSTTPLPRRKTGSCTLADLGCGDAPLARALAAQAKKWQLRVHSFDLHAPNEHVTVADIAHLPLRDGEADVAVFCLSLMGTNWLDFLEEAWRVLRGDGKGECWVAEVKSRFGRVSGAAQGGRRVVENSVGRKRKKQKHNTSLAGDNEENMEPDVFAESISERNEHDATDISAFVKVFERRGFKLKDGSVNKSNKMFVSMVFYKSGIPTVGQHKGKKWNGKEYQTVRKQDDDRTRFIEAGRFDDEIAQEEEANVLKPCVYKTR